MVEAQWHRDAAVCLSLLLSWVKRQDYRPVK